MKKTNVKVSSIVEYQLPEFVRVEYPLLPEFLKEYYRYTETNFGPSDIISNINDYIKLDSLSNIADIFYLYNDSYVVESIIKNQTTILNNESVIKVKTKTPHNLINGDFVDIVPYQEFSSELSDLIDFETYEFNGRRFSITLDSNNPEYEFFLNDSTLGINDKNLINSNGISLIIKSVIKSDQNEIVLYSKANNKKSLPIKYGLIQINNEIILFKDVDENVSTINVDGEEYIGIKLLNCVRGFSGTRSLGKDTEDQLIFEDTLAEDHFIRSEVINLNSIFLKKFLQKVKYQFLPGFENRDLNPDLNESVFIKQSKDFYSSKGTENSFKILFSVLYGEKVSVITPRDFLLEPSDAQYKVLRNLVVQGIEGNPEDLLNRTLFQDNVGFIGNARGTISAVERIERSGRTYYVISIDDGYERDINFRGTLFSSFSIHPKTYSIETIFPNSTTIEVDSTVSFPNSGNLVVHTTDPDTQTELIYNISYQSKTLNQFLGCKTIGSIIDNIRDTIYPNSEVFTDTYAYGFVGENRDQIIKVRISGVLSNFEQNEQTFLYESGNKIRVRSLGEESNRKKDNNWIYNIPVTYDIETAFVEDILDNSYRLTFLDEHNFHKSDTFYVDQVPDNFLVVKSVPSKNSIVARFDAPIGTPDQFGRVSQLERYSITRLLSKGLFINYPDLNIYNSNVQNVYLDKEKSLYVSSPSLPSYSDISGGPSPLDIRDGSVNGKFFFGKEFVNNGQSDKLYSDGSIDYAYFTTYSLDATNNLIIINHGFFTGDEVVFRSQDPRNSPFPDGIYYIKEFRSEGDPYGIKLASSRSNILNEKYVSPRITPPSTVPTITVADCAIQYYSFSKIDFKSVDNFKPQLIGPQNLIRKISDPIQDTVTYDTLPGATGIFLNGVEILNYKSQNSIFYGPIKSVDVVSSGFGYDVMSPPEFLIEDSGGAIVKYNAKSSIPLIYNDQPIKFGSIGGNVVTYGGIGGEEIKLGERYLLLGKNKLYINQTEGNTVRINGLLVTVGGSGGTQLSLGGEDGIDVRISEDFLTLGTLGSGCEIYPSINGKLEKVNIIYQGFNYIGIPKVSIKGGGGNGALVEPIMESFEYQAPFYPQVGSMNIANDTIGFATYHNFENYEEVIYISGISTTIYGLENRSRYIVYVEDGTTVKLYKSKEDAFAGISTVDIKAYSTGLHYLKSSKNKSKVGAINVISPGSGYKNRKTSTIPSNVNLVTNVITIPKHGYSSGDLIVHYSSGNLIGGIQANTSYYVTKIDDNNIKISEIYKDQSYFEAPQDFLYQTKQYLNLTSVGTGTHYFNYEPIIVSVEGFIGVSTSSGQDLNAKLQPVFRGEVDGIFVSKNGSGYGSPDILNYAKQPALNVIKGKNGQLLPIISSKDGSIVEVLVTNQGKDYVSIPDVIVRGDGNGAVLTPILKNGKIVEIKVIYGGLNYKQENTTIDIIDRGEGVKISTNITSWRINLLNRYRLTNRETNDGGFVYSGLNSEFGLQYTHIYLPDRLREILYNDYFENGSTVVDIEADRSLEKRHSPIVGWAYDGNPIYGPYGYENAESGAVKALKSGYSLFEGLQRIDGPPTSLYPIGFFIEDYEYKVINNGDLDESNGRYCKTPEFPNGTYAYFCTIDTTQILQDGFGYPSTFPYIIGNKYKSKPIEFNFDAKSNQNLIDINKTGWYRNTYPYNFNTKKNSRYQYLLVPNKIKDPISQIKYASYGEIEFVDIVVGGQNYKVGDKIKFENGDIIGQNATAEVSEIQGVDVKSVSVARSTFENVEFGKFGNGSELIGFTNNPHGYTTGDIVSISTPIERVVFKDINFSNNNLFLTKTVKPQSQTGIVTYFEVSGDLTYPTIRENDIYYIVDPGSISNSREEIKILNINKDNNVIRVSRSNNGYVGLTTYPSGTRLTEKSRKFNANLGIQTYYNFNVNYEYYFDASEVVGFGTKFGTGITSSIYFNYPKSGITSLSIPTRSIYLKEHGFNTNDPLKFSTNGSLLVSKSNDTINSFIIPQNSTVYAIKITDDLIGISTTRVGFGSTGSLFSVGANQDPLLCFVAGNGNSKFTTLKQNILNAKVSQSIVTVSTASSHGLLSGDIIDININPLNTKTVVIEYNDQARILVANPKEFEDNDVNIGENLFTITNHQYKTGDKVLYKSDNPISGLQDNEIYYVVVTDRNNFGLCNSLFESGQEFPKFLPLNSSTDGKFYQINPEIQVIKGQTIIFDISSNTLSFTQGSSTQRISSFSFDLYQDSNFNHKYISSGKTNIFDVSKIGTIGTTNAKLVLKISDDAPSTLFYKLTPLNINGNPLEKIGIFIDSEQSNNNKITITLSKYDGKYKIFDPIERDSTQPPFEFSEFKYQIPRDPESEFYDDENSLIKYNTSSKNASGSIVKASVKNKGRYFYRLPIKTTIESLSGTGSIITANSTNIGQIKSVNIKDIGFDYPSDLSIRAIAKLPTIYKVEPLYSIARITIVSNGINYLTAPNIDVIDAKTKKIITDLILSYNLGDNFVTIVRNTKNLSNIVPRLVPVDNSNGIPILLNQGSPIILTLNTNSEPEEVQLANDFSQLNLDDPDIDSLYSNLLSSSSTRVQSLPISNLPTIQVFLKTEYSSILDFPFELGDLVFIEDVITREETNGGTSKGFNSNSNGYSFYKVVKIDPNIGGSGASITLDFDEYVDEDVLEPENSDSYKVDEILSEAARVVPVKYFPIYSTVLEKNNFIQDEELITEDGTSIGIVEQWDSANDYLKIAETIVFNVGDTIIGQTSKTKAILLNKIDFDAGYNIADSSIVTTGWGLDTGKLNFDLQRIHDNDYYQYFSYALKSKVSIDKWNDDVGSLNHTAGFKRFSELELESLPISYSGISTSQEAISFGISDIISEVSVNCVYDFDLAREVTFGNPLKSNEIIFNSRILQDYIESISNRVLPIDDISKNFNALPRETNFSVVARSDSTEIRSKKTFFYIQDRRFTDDRQMQILTTLHDDENVYVGQYGRVETNYDMAYFESIIVGEQQVLQFYPAKDEVNNFIIDFVVFELTDDPTDIEELGFGDISYVYNQIGILTSGTSQGVGTTVVGIGSTFRSSKVLLQVSSVNRDYFELNEITVMHDDFGNTVLSEFGELTTSDLNNESVLGICSYTCEMSSDGSSLNVIMTPYENLTQDYDIKTITTSVSNEDISSTTGALSFETGQVTSFTISGISTEIPQPVLATQFSQQYKCSYLFVNVVGIQTGLVTPYNVGARDHGISDWYAFEDASVTYSAIFPETEIFEITPEGYVTSILTTSSTDPESGSVGITSGYRYFGSKGVHFMNEGSQHSIAPVSYASTTFGHFVADRGFTPGITTFFAYAPFGSTEIRLYDNSPNGIAGIASTSITLNSYQSGILTTSSLGSWVFFDSDLPVIMTVLGPGGTSGNDKTILSPCITGIGTINYKYYPNSLIVPSTERQRTAYNTFPSGASAGITTSGVYDASPIIAIRQSDGAGSDALQGILLDNLSDTYSWGNTLSDYVIAAPYPNTFVNVSYWNGSSWVLGESHNLSGGSFNDPKITQRDGTTGFGIWGTLMDGTAADLGSGSNIWKFESNQPFALIINDTVNDEEVLLGFSSTRSTRPINKEYKASEMQLTSNTRNSYLSEYGVVKISPSAGIGTVGVGEFSSRLLGGNTQLLFTPSPLVEYTINAFQVNVGRL
jgi:hypothetical protein